MAGAETNRRWLIYVYTSIPEMSIKNRFVAVYIFFIRRFKRLTAKGIIAQPTDGGSRGVLNRLTEARAETDPLLSLLEDTVMRQVAPSASQPRVTSTGKNKTFRTTGSGPRR